MGTSSFEALARAAETVARARADGGSPALDEAAAAIDRALIALAEDAQAERYRAHASPFFAPTWVFDCKRRRYVHVSDQLARLRGYARAELLAATESMWTETSTAFIKRVMRTRYEAFLAGERRRYVDELASTCRDGSVVWTETTSFFAHDEVTGHLLIVGTTQPLDMAASDGTDLSMVEHLQQLGKIGAFTRDPITGDARWTSEISRIHELSSRDHLGLISSQDETMRTGESFTTECAITTQGGNRKWLRIQCVPVLEHGAPVRVRGITQDITARKLAELELAEQRAHMQCLLDSLNDVIALKDTTGRVLAANSKLGRVFGLRKEQIVGHRIEEYASPEVAERYRLQDEAVVREACTINGEGWLTFADGHRELCEIVTTPVRDAGGDIIGTLRIARDVTAERATREKARETETQLRAIQKMEAVGRLAGGVAHDFNNLLSVILSYTNLIIESMPEAHELQEDLAEILAAGKRAEGLTRQLLAFSRRQLLQAAPLDIDEVVDTIGNMLRRLIGEDVDLKIKRSQALFVTKADRGQLEQVIMNLVVNARDAMPDGGKITIASRNATIDEARGLALEVPPGDYVELAIGDTGTGMDAATLARVFEPFFTTKGVGKGTGLGLAMAYGIVKQSGGAIAVTSTVGAGTTFRIYLPRFEGSLSTPKSPPSQRNRSRGEETVLVVEDEHGLRTVVKRILARAGYRVLLASGTNEAMAIAREEGSRIDLVFTDVVMPGGNGGELVERLGPHCPRMKVIFTSGYTDEKLARSGVGEHCFIAKPYQPAQLTETIRSVLDGKPPVGHHGQSIAPASMIGAGSSSGAYRQMT